MSGVLPDSVLNPTGSTVYGSRALDLHYLIESLNTLWGRQSYLLWILELTEGQ